MMLLYGFIREEAADPRARWVAAEELVERGLLRRERFGPSPMFLWLAFLTALLVTLGVASTVGPMAAVVFAAGVVALGAYAVRRRGRRERDSEPVYIGPHGERLRCAPEPDAGAGSDPG